MVALKSLYDFLRPISCQYYACVSLSLVIVFETCYKAPFLEPQDHARMTDIKLPVLMVAKKSLYDFTWPNSCHFYVFETCLRNMCVERKY